MTRDFSQEGKLRGSALERFAENAARTLPVRGRASGRAMAAETRRSLRAIEGFHARAERRWDGAANMPGAVRWLLDNHYLAQREGLAAAEALGGTSPLPSSGGRALLLGACDSLLAGAGCCLDADVLTAFLAGFQRIHTLDQAELSAFPWGLRSALLGRLSALFSGEEGEELPEGAEQAAAGIFTSLRWLAGGGIEPVLENANALEQALCRDPSGVYPLMDEDSRAEARRELCRLAKKQGIAETEAARIALELACAGDGEKAHVLWWVYRQPLARDSRRTDGAGWYIALNLLFTLALCLFSALWTGSAAVFFLLLLPVSDLVKSLLDFIVLGLVQPRTLMRLELAGGVPEEGRTLCAVSCLLCGEKDGPSLAEKLEQLRLCSRDCGENLLFALIADLPDSDAESLPGSEEWLNAAAGAINALNEKTGGGFFLLTRPRRQNAEGRWMGWERKRGALLETMHFLRGEESGIFCAAGEAEALRNMRYLLALDADTRLGPENARELIGAMLHPLNRAVTDPERRIVTGGYGILSPRVSPSLTGDSDFSLAFAGHSGADPYAAACGEVYMDCFGRGGFTGKGIMDIDACLYCLEGRIPENLVLSHDAIEGAYLRAGLVSTTELLDDFPARPLAYYKRMHRWVRGDWQNISWLFGRGKDLPALEKWKLFDSLRRSLVPPATLCALCAGFFLPGTGPYLAAGAALLCFACQLLLSLSDALLAPAEGRRLRFQSRVLLGTSGGFVRTLLRLVLLPAEAYFCLDAIIRSLWRLGVSRKRLLQWQTAGQSAGAGASLPGNIAAMWPVSVLGLALALLSPVIPGKAAGTLWFFCPLCAWLLGLPRRKNKPLPASQRAWLLGCAAEIWGWFDTYLSPGDHYLPPDNVQERPPAGVARRTSPTNIGLALLSLLCAMDLDLSGQERCLFLAEKMLETVEKLEKRWGQLYNWYDTRTLEVLRPAYISTVDSGNLYACLCAVCSGLKRYGRPDLAERAAELCEAMDFRPLYDKRRALFAIGYDAEKDDLSSSWYDLLSSEARLTAYIAIAKGDAPRRHWRRLSRAQVQLGHYRGMASWTGTMFEYLMPELLLPLYPSSLLDETARFCLYAQRRRVSGTGKPWGISESAFYSLDPSLCYRYKAHGVSALALRPGMDAELVLAPYASFLALAVDPAEAVRNLRRLESLGARGKYGFWEAIDFTPGRCRAGKGEVVQSVMSHHLGMSLAAIANCLTGGRLREDFMDTPEMGAHQILLQEKVPAGGPVLRRKQLSQPERPRHGFQGDWKLAGKAGQDGTSDCCLLAGQACSCLMTASGDARPAWGGLTPYLPWDEEGGGLRLYWEGPETSCPLLEDSDWEFAPQYARFRRETEDFSVAVTAMVSDGRPGEVRRVEIIPTAGCGETRLALCFSPLLASLRDWESHPAFWRLGLSFRVLDGVLEVRRLARGALPELWLCLACSRPCVFESVPGLSGGRMEQERLLAEDWFWPEDPETRCRVPFPAGKGSALRCVFSLGLGHSEKEARETALSGLKLEETEAGDMPRRAAAVLGLDFAGFCFAWSLIPFLAYPGKPGEGYAGQDGLWRFGISGDLPVLCARCGSPDRIEQAQKLLDTHLLLSGCGLDFDLAFLVRDGGRYDRPVYNALSDRLWRSGGDLLGGAKGGVHLVEDGPGTEGLIACAALVLDLDGETIALPSPPPLPPAPPERGRKKAALPSLSWTAEGSFIFACAGALPPRVWTNVLTNGRFSALAADCGSGNMWFQNAREYPLTPWLCRPLSQEGPEALTLELDKRRISLFADADGLDCRVRFAFGAAVWEKRAGDTEITVTAFVPPDTDARVLLVRLRGLEAGARLRWRLDLAQAGRREDWRFCAAAHDGGVLTAENDRSVIDSPPFSALSSPAFDRFTCDRDKALSGHYGGETGRFARPAFGLCLPAEEECVLVCGCDSPEKLRALCSPKKAGEALSRTLDCWRDFTSRFRLRSPCPELDRLANGWLAYQTLACRMLARCSAYQCGGAYGFRDQLQDAANLIVYDSALCREQILRCCRRQYLEGDVQHWWHELSGQIKGLRSRCSDDLLWLPWAVCEYVERTGDGSIWAEEAEYLSSPPLRNGERDRFETAAGSGLSGSVLDHCRRAVDLVLRRGAGEHGLLLMGAGDWNDGFDQVAGESQWLTWFFCCVGRKLREHTGAFGDLDGQIRRLTESANAAWDGDWFLRGYYAGGAPLGSRKSGGCQIDSIAQSFAAFCPGADREKTLRALDSAWERLFDRSAGVIRLFDPPFDGQGELPGYISGYGPGLRENGGQYTHAAVWLAMAFLRTRQPERGWELLRALLPSGKDPEIYRGEPFVLSADLCAVPGREGEAGWTWYTGSAGWMLRAVTEELLGLRLRGGLLFIEPSLPPDWGAAEYSYKGHAICAGPDGITVDGQAYHGGGIEI